MEKRYIEYDGKEYVIEEPTVELWNKLNLLKDLYEGNEFSLMLISVATGLPIEDIRKADWESVYETSHYLADYFLTHSEKFYKDFEFNGVKYGFIDLENLTFGEFIDIDEFLNRPEVKRNTELNYLLALLYREIGEDGKVVPYDATKVKDRSDLFRQLPIKYISAWRFFFHLENILRESTRSFLHKMMYQLKWKMKRHLRAFGVGMGHLYIYLVKTYSKLTRWLKRVY